MHLFNVVKKFNIILSKRQKLRMVVLAVLMVIGGLLETLSVSLLLPFMNVVMEPDKYMSNDIAKILCSMFGINSSHSFLLFISILLAVLFLCKDVFLIFEYYVQYRFVYGNMFDMQERLLSNLVNRPYEFFLRSNSGEIIRIINSDTPEVFLTLSILLMLFTELVVSGMMIVTVFLIAPIISLVIAAVLVLLLILITVVLKPILRRSGEESQASAAGMNKWLLQTIQGIKELKVTNKEAFFHRKFIQYGKKYIVALRKKSTLSVAPRFIIESVSMCSMFGFVAFMIWRGDDLQSVIPIFAAVALAAMRLIPSISRISTSLSAISYSEPMLDKLIENLNDSYSSKTTEVESNTSNESGVPPVSIKPFRKELRLSGVTYSYPGSEESVLKGADLIIKKGQSVGLVGTSGAGKTTAVDVLLGFLEPQSGQVLIDGVDISDNKPAFLSMIGYIPQSIFMLDDTIRSNVAFGEESVSDEDVWRALREASLYDFVKDLPDGLDTEIGERGVRLSGGQRQRIGIARALYRNPAILVFDEATSSLDNETEKSIIDSINHLKGDKTMIIIAHRLSTIENCDVVYRVEDGAIIPSEDEATGVSDVATAPV